ncbi:membrane bound O-acyl transferase family-domain-containing protein [Aspergillus floccosus]
MSLLHALSVQLITLALLFSVCVIRYTLCSVLITCTRKGSLARYFGFATLVFLSVVQAASAVLLPLYLPLRTYMGVECFLHTLQAFNLVILLELDAADLESEGLFHPQARLSKRIWSGVYLHRNYRGIRTKWQVKNTPNFPPCVKKPMGLSPNQFCMRQSIIAAWQLFSIALAVRLVQSIVPKSTTCGEVLPLSKGFLRAWQGLLPLVWIVINRSIIDIAFRLNSVASVIMGLTTPVDWPPLFNSTLDAWTLRRFWGLYWHQWLRWPFTAMATFLVTKILRISKPGPVYRYIHVLCVFSLSGIFHLINDVLQGVRWPESGALLFFCSFTMGFMIEDGTQELWRHLTGKHAKTPSNRSDNEGQSKDTAPTVTPLWKRLVGFLWVWVWMSIMTPVYMRPFLQAVCRHGTGSDVLRMIRYLNPGIGVVCLTTGALLIWRHIGINI